MRREPGVLGDDKANEGQIRPSPLRAIYGNLAHKLDLSSKGVDEVPAGRCKNAPLYSSLRKIVLEQYSCTPNIKILDQAMVCQKF